MAGEAPGAVAPSEQWGDWRPQTAAEIAEEMARLRELAQRVRFQPATVKKFASQWLRPSRSEHAALTRWHNGAHRKEPRGLLATDLQDAVRLIARATEPSKWQDDPEAFAKRLEYVAGSLKGKLLCWLDTYCDGSEEWEPESAAEADGLPAPLGHVVQFRLYGDQYARMIGIRMNSPNPFLRLRDAMQSLAEDVAGAVVASGEDAKPLFRLLAFAEHNRRQDFSAIWNSDVLPMLKTTETKLKAAADPPQGNAAEDGSESPAAADTAATAGSKQRKHGGGRKPQRTRTALERKVFRLREQGWSFEEIDQEHLATEESAKNRSSFHVIERVQRRERRHKKADKTGQN